MYLKFEVLAAVKIVTLSQSSGTEQNPKTLKKNPVGDESSCSGSSWLIAVS
jgi:hypothetical protein